MQDQRWLKALRAGVIQLISSRLQVNPCFEKEGFTTSRVPLHSSDWTYGETTLARPAFS